MNSLTLHNLGNTVSDLQERLRTFPEPALTDRPSRPLRIYFREITAAVENARAIGLVDDFALALRGWRNGANDTEIEATLNYVGSTLRRALHEASRAEDEANRPQRNQQTKNRRRQWRKSQLVELGL